MKKIILAALTVITSFSTIAQQRFVVDKSEKTKQLFDLNDPLSLLSMIGSEGWDRITFKEGISSVDFKRLSPERKGLFIKHIGQPGTTPLMVEDKNSPHYGEPLIVTDVNGMQSFVYDAPDTVLYSVNGVDRMIFSFDSIDSREYVSRIELQTSLDGKFMTLLDLEGFDLLRFDNYEYLRDFTGDQREKLVATGGYWEDLKSIRAKSKPGYIKGLKFFKVSPYQSNEYLNDLPNFSINEIKNAKISDGNKFSKLEEKLLRDSTLLNPYFDSVYFKVYYGNAPLIDEDPNSSNFGKPLIVYDSNGLASFVYDPPASSVHWLDFNPIFGAKETIHSDASGRISSKIVSVYTFSEIDDSLHVVSCHLLDDEWNKVYFSQINSIVDWNEHSAILHGLVRRFGKVE